MLDHVSTLDVMLLCMIAKETHKDGNSHLHACVKYVDGVTAKNELKFDFEFEGKKFHGHCQPVRSCKAVMDFCSKENNYVSHFNLKSHKDKKGKTAVTIKTLKNKTVQQALKDGDMSFHQARQHQFARQLVEEPCEHHTTRGIRIHGKLGAGKSHLAREHVEAPGVQFCNSQQNKWFDGYNREKVILFDDFDMSGTVLSQKLKLWADEHACTTEIKGSTVQLAHDELIITSQCTIEEIWPDDSELQEALNRRFRKINLTCDCSKHPDPLTLTHRVDQMLASFEDAIEIASESKNPESIQTNADKCVANCMNRPMSRSLKECASSKLIEQCVSSSHNVKGGHQFKHPQVKNV